MIYGVIEERNFPEVFEGAFNYAKVKAIKRTMPRNRPQAIDAEPGKNAWLMIYEQA